MDDKTTLVVFGDHGMTTDGNHGGLTDLEMRSALFAYQKTPFHMYKHYNKPALRSSFEEMDKTLKQLDITPIVSSLLKQPVPFTNMGFIHPLFVPSPNLRDVH